MTQYLKRKQKQSGFTLVELLVVIAIIGILTAIGVPMYNGYQASAKVSATKQNFDAMKTFIAGEVTKCSAGLVPQLNDPKAATPGTGGAAASPVVVNCPAGLTVTTGSDYFTAYGLATIKNPYNTSSKTAVVDALGANPGELVINGSSCTGGIAIQTSILDPNSTSTTPVPYPASPDCISVQ